MTVKRRLRPYLIHFLVAISHAILPAPVWADLAIPSPAFLQAPSPDHRHARFTFVIDSLNGLPELYYGVIR